MTTEFAVANAPDFQIRPAAMEDLWPVWALYRRVALTSGGIARLHDEIDESYVEQFLSKSVAGGVALVAVDKTSEIIAEIHAYQPGPWCFSHMLSELTVIVDPRVQGTGIGRALFDEFLRTVEREHPHILRIELIARQSNRRALKLYQSLGFKREGELHSRIRNTDGTLESDVPMAWTR